MIVAIDREESRVPEAIVQSTMIEDFFVGEYLVQPNLGTVTRQTKSHHLEPKTMHVLMCLASHPDSLVSKDEILHQVWPETFVTEHVLTQAIFQLRRVFSDGEVIQTIPRRGYRLRTPVRPAFQHKPTIAVLPLLNLSGNTEQDYFVDGMTEALISALAQIGALRVISRTSVMLYRSTSKPLPQIASELHADHVVEGSVSRDGERVRVAVQLIKAANDEHIWAKNYDRELPNILQLQDEVARAIASEIHITLTPEEHRRMVRSRPVNPAAHELYLKGRYCYFRTTAEALRMSIEFMQQSIALDPEYSLAYAGLASSAALLSSGIVSAMPPIEAVKLVRPAVRRSLELDPDLPEAHHISGWIKLFCEWDWAGAEEAYGRAVSLNPSNAQGYGSLAWVHLALNRPGEALVSWQQACKLDPLSPFFQTLLGFTLAMTGAMEKAVEQFERTIAFEPNYYYPHAVLSGALSFAGRHEEAIAEAETAVHLWNGPAPRAYVGYVYARAGRVEEARKTLATLLEYGKCHYVSGQFPAAILAALGESELALDYLETAQRMHDSDIVFIRTFPAWQPLHGHPRFESIVKAMNFPA